MFKRSKNLAAALALAGLVGWGAALPASASTPAPSAATGKAISAMCQGCHGSNGIAINGQYPNLAGQNYGYLLQQLKAFKNGERKNPIMGSFAKALTLQKMKDIAAYFSSVPIGYVGKKEKPGAKG